jgi:hypothetical protein
LYNFHSLGTVPRLDHMPPTRFTLQYVGAEPTVPEEVSRIFASAGYRISRARSAGGRSRGRGVGTWVGSDLTDAQVRSLLGQEKATGRQFRTFAIALVPSARKLGRNDGGRAAPPRFKMTLQALRESVGRTQGELARLVSMTQPQLSRVEARQDHLTSTLRRYIQALGGDMEIVARVGGARVILKDV